MKRWRGRAAAVLTGVAGLTLLVAGTAQAHVRVSAPKAVVGQPATLDFRVPSEEQVATTVRLSITVPADVKVTKVPARTAWVSLMAKDTAGDTVLTWTAQQSGIAPDAAVDFLADTSAVPDRPMVSFAVVQTYSNGDTVYWTQKQVGQTEPPYPAPALKVAGATSGAQPDSPGLIPGPDGAAAPSASPSVKPAAPNVAAAPAPAPRHTGVSGWFLGLGIVGGAAVGAGIALAAVFLRRRPAAA